MVPLTHPDEAGAAGSLTAAMAITIWKNNDHNLRKQLSDVLTAMEAAIAAGIADGDYGDITVSGSGTVFTLDLNLATIDTPTASVSFAQQEATQFRIENRTSDPGAPLDGEIWLRTDL